MPCIGSVVFFCLLTGFVSYAQDKPLSQAPAPAPEGDWKKTNSLPAVDLNNLSPDQKATALKMLREQDCSCGCNMKIAQCRMVDPNCSYSKGLAAAIVNAIRQGKSEADALAAAKGSKWASSTHLLEDPVSIPTTGSPSTGPQNARITLVEFSDFQCPYCAAVVPEIQALLKAYPTQIKLIFKEYPLDFHSQADLAAAAAIAAHKQGKFWAMHDAMFANRNDLSRKNILDLAKKNGIDLNRFERDIDSTEVRETVVRDIQDGDRAGVEGTPTMFVNGQRYNGPIAVFSLKPVIEAALKQGPANQRASANP